MNIVSLVGAAAIAALSFGSKPVGYLGRLGPAPLRFQAPTKGPDVTVALPPLRMCEPPATLREVTTNEIATIEAPAQPAAPTPTPQPAPVEPAFMPQMLLQYFTHGGTNQETSIVVPFQFTPPVAPVIPAPPSRATYTKQ